MKLHELSPQPGSKKKPIRRGRGDGSGRGTFSGHGCKGQNARAGGGVRPGFEGGQTPLMRRMPKLKGFVSPRRISFLPINFDLLEEKFSDGDVVSLETLREKRLISSSNTPVKILGRGVLTKKLTFEGVRLSHTAQKALESSSGSRKKKKEDTPAE